MDDTQSIEFQDIKKEAQPLEIVRKSFRVPVEEDGDIQVIIANQTFQVTDISLIGVSILCKQGQTLTVSQIYKGCELVTPDGKIQDLDGKVIHFSSAPGKKWNNGIQWIDLSDDAKAEINALVASRKEKLLKSQDT